MRYYINLVGGLGNQLYNLAYGDYLSRTHGVRITGYINLYKAQTATPKSVLDRTARPLYQDLISYLGYKLLSQPSRSWLAQAIRKCFVEKYEEPYIHAGVFYPQLPPKTESAFLPLSRELVGNFQSYKYVGDAFRQTIREFVLAQAPNGLVEVEDVDVALHIRRGDFLKAPDLYRCYELDYYLEALSLLSEQKPIGKVYVFSDDFSAIEKEIEGLREHYTCVLIMGQTAIEDLATLSCFRRYALGNSTFSWWGALLSRHKDDVSVVVPKYPVKVVRLEDSYYPPHWYTISDKID